MKNVNITPQNIRLGQKTEYSFNYDKELLVAIPRQLGRSKINIPETNNNFQGVDIWNCYEMSWLSESGLPRVRLIRFYVQSDSENIVESKSLKLYLNSFTNHHFKNDEEVMQIITKDLSELLLSQVKVEMYKLSDFNNQNIASFNAESIDIDDVEISDYNVNKDLLKIESQEIVSEALYSDLLKSNCLVTNQPDWASVYIKYKGAKIDRTALLRYIISFRNHSEFHEQCVEHIFTDIMSQLQPQELTVYAKYTRRGGIDINPYRTNLDYVINDIDQIRAVRQ